MQWDVGLTVEQWDNLWSGFAGALIGALVALLGSVAIYLVERRSRRRAVRRAVCAEIEGNRLILEMLLMRTSQPPHGVTLDRVIGEQWPFITTTYYSTLPVLAGAMSGRDLSILSLLYLSLPEAEAIRQKVAGRPGVMLDENDRRTLEHVLEVLDSAFEVTSRKSGR